MGRKKRPAAAHRMAIDAISMTSQALRSGGPPLVGLESTSIGRWHGPHESDRLSYLPRWPTLHFGPLASTRCVRHAKAEN